MLFLQEWTRRRLDIGQISCEYFALGNLRAERETRESTLHCGRAPYEDAFIRVAHETQGKGELDLQA